MIIDQYDKSRDSIFSNNLKSTTFERPPVLKKPPLAKESVTTYRLLKKELLVNDRRRTKSTQDKLESMIEQERSLAYRVNPSTPPGEIKPQF